MKVIFFLLHWRQIDPLSVGGSRFGGFREGLEDMIASDLVKIVEIGLEVMPIQYPYTMNIKGNSPNPHMNPMFIQDLSFREFLHDEDTTSKVNLFLEIVVGSRKITTKENCLMRKSWEGSRR